MSNDITLTEFKCFTVPCVTSASKSTDAKVVLYIESEWMGLTCLRRIDKQRQYMICAIPKGLSSFAEAFTQYTKPDTPLSFKASVVFIDVDLACEIGYEIPAKE